LAKEKVELTIPEESIKSLMEKGLSREEAIQHCQKLLQEALLKLSTNNPRTENESENPKAPATSLENRLMELEQRYKEMEEFVVETRRASVMQSHSVPFLNYQFKRILADNFALTQSLADVEKEVALRYTSYEHAMRDRARLSEKERYSRKYLEFALQQYRATADENVLLKGQIERLKKELAAKDQIIKGTEGIIEAVRNLIQQKKLPPDVLAELKSILPEIPKPISHAEVEEEEIL